MSFANGAPAEANWHSCTCTQDRTGLDTLSQKLLLACSLLLDLTAELKHAAALAGGFQLQGECDTSNKSSRC